jgi:hypothetical protein
MKCVNIALKLFIVLFIFLNLASTCNKSSVKNETIWVYQTKQDYFDKVAVELSEDKSEITAFPGPNDVNNKWPVRLTNGYFLNGSFGLNSGYLSLTKEEYGEYLTALPPDTLYKLLIDKDPFISFYSRDDHDNRFWDENGAYGIDTAFINELIRKDKLENYFIKLK